MACFNILLWGNDGRAVVKELLDCELPPGTSFPTAYTRYSSLRYRFVLPNGQMLNKRFKPDNLPKLDGMVVVETPAMPDNCRVFVAGSHFTQRHLVLFATVFAPIDLVIIGATDARLATPAKVRDALFNIGPYPPPIAFSCPDDGDSGHGACTTILLLMDALQLLRTTDDKEALKLFGPEGNFGQLIEGYAAAKPHLTYDTSMEGLRKWVTENNERYVRINSEIVYETNSVTNGLYGLPMPSVVSTTDRRPYRYYRNTIIKAALDMPYNNTIDDDILFYVAHHLVRDAVRRHDSTHPLYDELVKVLAAAGFDAEPATDEPPAKRPCPADTVSLAFAEPLVDV